MKCVLLADLLKATKYVSQMSADHKCMGVMTKVHAKFADVPFHLKDW